MRRESEAQDSALAAARMCTVRFRPKLGPGSVFDRVHIEFRNKLDETVLVPKLIGQHDKILKSDAQVAPGRPWGTTVALSELGLAGRYSDEPSARQALNGSNAKESVKFEFALRGWRFTRVGKVVTLVGSTRD